MALKNFTSSFYVARPPPGTSLSLAARFISLLASGGEPRAALEAEPDELIDEVCHSPGP